MPWLSRWCPLLWKDRGHTDIFGGKPEGPREEMRAREGTERDVRKREQWRSERRGSPKVNNTKKSAWFLLVIPNLLGFCTHIKTCTSSQDTFWEGWLFKQWAGSWNCSCMLKSILIPSLCQRLDRLSLSASETQDGTRGSDWGTKSWTLK